MPRPSGWTREPEPEESGAAGQQGRADDTHVQSGNEERRNTAFIAHRLRSKPPAALSTQGALSKDLLSG